MSVAIRTVDTLAEAARVLAAEPGARLWGGGTLLMRGVNEGDQSVTALVLTREPAMRAVSAAGERIALGAGVTMAQVLAERALDFLHPVARAVGGPAVREAATVGGNLFAPHPYGDFATALLALEARATLADGRDVGVEDLLRDRDRARPAVARVSFARPPSLRFAKVQRVHPRGVTVMSIAAVVPETGGAARGARIAWGAMGPSPLRGRAAEQALEGRALDRAGIAPALAVATQGLAPADDALGSAWWRREIAPVHLRRLLLGEP